MVRWGTEPTKHALRLQLTPASAQETQGSGLISNRVRMCAHWAGAATSSTC